MISFHQSRRTLVSPSAVAYDPTNDVILMSHWEVMFLRAEAALRYGTADNDKTMYDNAVTAHFHI
ncbi:MAG: SusD/RagB family nutrient-binding outer membrane lipoprotein [Saprospiraceae bacterium]|nr:SusD/RagB family nutrient-binding outer membrane lipoprotein [Saprospiraceae bacterium]